MDFARFAPMPAAEQVKILTVVGKRQAE